jgi:hypothetical protein
LSSSNVAQSSQQIVGCEWPLLINEALPLVLLVNLLKNRNWLHSLHLREILLLLRRWFNDVVTENSFWKGLLELIVLSCLREVPLLKHCLMHSMRWYGFRFERHRLLQEIVLLGVTLGILPKWTVLMSVFIKYSVVNSSFSLSF